MEEANRRPNDAYVVALFVDNEGPVQDYHWYQHNADGAWSGKGFNATAAGTTAVSCTSGLPVFQQFAISQNCVDAITASYTDRTR